MKLRFTPRAVQDLEELADYLHARNPTAAQRVRAAIYETLQVLIRFPRGWAEPDDGRSSQGRDAEIPLFIYYTFDAARDELVILNVKHPAQHRDYTET